ncbi:MAG: FTR1 family iron permease [Rhodoferax sp.]
MPPLFSHFPAPPAARSPSGPGIAAWRASGAARVLAWLLRCAALCALVLLAPRAAWAETDGAAVTAALIERGEQVVAQYQSAQGLATASAISQLYFNQFEGLELDLGMRAPALKTELEVLFGAVTSQALEGAPPAQLQASWAQLRAKLEQAAALYGEPQAAGFASMLLKSVLILVREGTEAMLVVGALAAYLRRAGGADRVWVLHAGVGAAVLLSLLTGWALTGVLQSVAASRTLIEGLSLLLAAAVLFYVSFWLFSKSEARRWQAWIAQQLDSALSSGSLAALALAAFLAVYREGAETVLFYHALYASEPTQLGALLAGLGLGVALLVLLYLLYRHTALKLPMHLFFGATAALLYTMAVVFLGQAMVELQAAGWVRASAVAGVPHISWLGVAPTVQGLGAQTGMALLPLLAWLWMRRSAGPQARAS